MTVGKAIGHAELETEGKADRIEGGVQNAFGGLKDTLSREKVSRRNDRANSSGERSKRAQAHERSNDMSRSMLYLLIGLLAAGILVVGYLYHQESQSGIDIEIGEQGITIEGN
jgi:uncharacterized protein YjbJ (UPF0337 family)